MAELKTRQTDADPRAFLEGIPMKPRREDGLVLLDWFGDVTGLPARIWGDSIVGYGRYHYRYDSGREGDYFLTGFSPRKAALTVYVMPGYRFGEMPDLMARLGRYRTGASCLYITRLSHIDMGVLGDIVVNGLSYMTENYQTWDV